MISRSTWRSSSCFIVAGVAIILEKNEDFPLNICPGAARRKIKTNFVYFVLTHLKSRSAQQVYRSTFAEKSASKFEDLSFWISLSTLLQSHLDHSI